MHGVLGVHICVVCQHVRTATLLTLMDVGFRSKTHRIYMCVLPYQEVRGGFLVFQKAQSVRFSMRVSVVPLACIMIEGIAREP